MGLDGAKRKNNEHLECNGVYGMHPLTIRTRAAVNRMYRGSLRSPDFQKYDDSE
jgi:hypothetical protein